MRQLYAYWLSVHPAGGGLPGRQHVDPAALPSLLPNIWLVDVQREPLRFRYRLFGTAQVTVVGSDLTGQWLDEAHPTFLTSVAYAQFVAAVERGEPGYRSGHPFIIVPKDYLMMERLILPLARDGTTVDMLLAISVYHKKR
ncbi:MAG TPA: PAS domain-containing protein [Stellaceae bacterium]|nr:PAS domain-containing protein [Stellaceae bacterium]